MLKSRPVAAALALAFVLSCDAHEETGDGGPLDGAPGDPHDAASDGRGSADGATVDATIDGGDDRVDDAPPLLEGSSTVDTGTLDRRDVTGADVTDPDVTGGDGGDARSADASGERSVDAGSDDVIDAADDLSSDAGAGDATCTGVIIDPPAAPLNLLILFDQSLSMADYLDSIGPPTRWTAVTGAILEFLQLSEALPHSIGLQYFELIDPGTSMTSCAPAQYAVPAVEIAPLTDAAQFPALSSSIQSHMPTGWTPTAAALKGALDHAKPYALAHPERPTMVALLTDGVPTVCQPMSTSDIGTTIAGPAFSGTPSIRTTVIGVGSGLASLASIGTAGGGGTQLVNIPATTAADTKQALVRIARSHFTCSLALPTTDAGTAVDPALVNVVVMPNGAPGRTLPLFSSAGGCGDGWYYDNPGAPTSIRLCPTTCNDVAVNSATKIVVGCPSPPPM